MEIHPGWSQSSTFWPSVLPQLCVRRNISQLSPKLLAHLSAVAAQALVEISCIHVKGWCSFMSMMPCCYFTGHRLKGIFRLICGRKLFFRFLHLTPACTATCKQHRRKVLLQIIYKTDETKRIFLSYNLQRFIQGSGSKIYKPHGNICIYKTVFLHGTYEAKRTQPKLKVSHTCSLRDSLQPWVQRLVCAAVCYMQILHSFGCVQSEPRMGCVAQPDRTGKFS